MLLTTGILELMKSMPILCKKRLGLEGVGGEGGCILKLFLPKGGVQFLNVIIGGGGVKFLYTTLFTVLIHITLFFDRHSEGLRSL